MEVKSGEGTVVVADRNRYSDECCNNRGWGSGWGAVGGALVGGGFGAAAVSVWDKINDTKADIQKVESTVQEAKAGKIEYRLDKTNIIHCPIGKASFGVEKLQENFETLMGAIVKAKPAAAKGQYVKSCVLATTMGPGVKVNPSKFC